MIYYIIILYIFIVISYYGSIKSEDELRQIPILELLSIPFMMVATFFNGIYYMVPIINKGKENE